MYNINDNIIYGSTGVCKIEDICTPDFAKELGINKLYYKISPVYRSETIYIPIDTKNYMRPIVTKEEAEDLISKMPQIKESDFEGKDHRALAEKYKLSIKTHECEDLISLIKTVYFRSQDMISQGKKPGQTDMQYLKQAEDLLYGELAIALEISIKEVRKYIENKIGK